MYKGNKEREALLQKDKKNAETIQQNTELTNENNKNTKLYETSENNGFQNLAFESDESIKNV